MLEHSRPALLDELTAPRNALKPDSKGRIVWGNGTVTLVFAVSDDRPVTLIGMSGRGMEPVDANIACEPDAQPIVELRSSLDGGGDNRLKLAVSSAGLKLRFVRAYELNRLGDERQPVTLLAIVQRDPDGDGPLVTSVFEATAHTSAVRTYTRLCSEEPYPVEAVSSMNATLPMEAAKLEDAQAQVYWGESSWDCENAWQSAPLRSTTLRDRNQVINPGMSSARFARRSTSTWSTGEFEPMGIVEGGGRPGELGHFSFAWQIEHNGAWEWEIGEDDPGLRVSAYGPEYDDHQWFIMLRDNQPFVTVPVSFVVCAGDWQHAVAEMTVQRRALYRAKAMEMGRLEQAEQAKGLVVYNDYMNTLWGDPRIEKELPLVEGAAKVGADVFCIDAGWYDSEDGGWWDMVGEWKPSMNRFGDIRLAGLIHDIQSHGMKAGLWLEPEVIGVRSPLAKMLPDSAFFCRHGVRIADQGRYHLDFRSPVARAHATATVDRLIDEFNVRFFKFDYNTTPGAGTDVDTDSVGEGLLEHCRAVQQWIEQIRAKHPDVMIENCGSGAMRADYAMLSRLDMQSTSDQSDPLVYAAIAAGAGMTVLPEQQGNWGYAQQEMDDETAVFTLAAGILGRLYLSGFIDRMDEARLGLVRDAIALHRTILGGQSHLVPWWPCGLPDFNSPWLVYGLRHAPNVTGLSHDEDWNGTDGQGSEHVDEAQYLTIWRRGGINSLYLEIGEGAHIEQVFPNPAKPEHAPDAKPWRIEWADSETVRIEASADKEPSARVFAITFPQPSADGTADDDASENAGHDIEGR